MVLEDSNLDRTDFQCAERSQNKTHSGQRSLVLSCESTLDCSEKWSISSKNDDSRRMWDKTQRFSDNIRCGHFSHTKDEKPDVDKSQNSCSVNGRHENNKLHAGSFHKAADIDISSNVVLKCTDSQGLADSIEVGRDGSMNKGVSSTMDVSELEVAEPEDSLLVRLPDISSNQLRQCETNRNPIQTISYSQQNIHEFEQNSDDSQLGKRDGFAGDQIQVDSKSYSRHNSFVDDLEKNRNCFTKDEVQAVSYSQQNYHGYGQNSFSDNSELEHYQYSQTGKQAECFLTRCSLYPHTRANVVSHHASEDQLHSEHIPRDILESDSENSQSPGEKRHIAEHRYVNAKTGNANRTHFDSDDSQSPSMERQTKTQQSVYSEAKTDNVNWAHFCREKDELVNSPNSSFTSGNFQIVSQGDHKKADNVQNDTLETSNEESQHSINNGLVTDSSFDEKVSRITEIVSRMAETFSQQFPQYAEKEEMARDLDASTKYHIPYSPQKENSLCGTDLDETVDVVKVAAVDHNVRMFQQESSHNVPMHKCNPTIPNVPGQQGKTSRKVCFDNSETFETENICSVDHDAPMLKLHNASAGSHNWSDISSDNDEMSGDTSDILLAVPNSDNKTAITGGDSEKLHEILAVKDELEDLENNESVILLNTEMKLQTTHKDKPSKSENCSMNERTIQLPRACSDRSVASCDLTSTCSMKESVTIVNEFIEGSERTEWTQMPYSEGLEELLHDVSEFSFVLDQHIERHSAEATHAGNCADNVGCDMEAGTFGDPADKIIVQCDKDSSTTGIGNKKSREPEIGRVTKSVVSMITRNNGSISCHSNAILEENGSSIQVGLHKEILKNRDKQAISTELKVENSSNENVAVCPSSKPDTPLVQTGKISESESDPISSVCIVVEDVNDSVKNLQAMKVNPAEASDQSRAAGLLVSSHLHMCEVLETDPKGRPPEHKDDLVQKARTMDIKISPHAVASGTEEMTGSSGSTYGSGHVTCLHIDAVTNTNNKTDSTPGDGVKLKLCKDVKDHESCKNVNSKSSALIDGAQWSEMPYSEGLDTFLTEADKELEDSEIAFKVKSADVEICEMRNNPEEDIPHGSVQMRDCADESSSDCNCEDHNAALITTGEQSIKEELLQREGNLPPKETQCAGVAKHSIIGRDHERCMCTEKCINCKDNNAMSFTAEQNANGEIARIHNEFPGRENKNGCLAPSECLTSELHCQTECHDKHHQRENENRHLSSSTINLVSQSRNGAAYQSDLSYYSADGSVDLFEASADLFSGSDVADSVLQDDMHSYEGNIENVQNIEIAQTDSCDSDAIPGTFNKHKLCKKSLGRKTKALQSLNHSTSNTKHVQTGEKQTESCNTGTVPDTFKKRRSSEKSTARSAQCLSHSKDGPKRLLNEDVRRKGKSSSVFEIKTGVVKSNLKAKIPRKSRVKSVVFSQDLCSERTVDVIDLKMAFTPSPQLLRARQKSSLKSASRTRIEPLKERLAGTQKSSLKLHTSVESAKKLLGARRKSSLKSTSSTPIKPSKRMKKSTDEKENSPHEQPNSEELFTPSPIYALVSSPETPSPCRASLDLIPNSVGTPMFRKAILGAMGSNLVTNSQDTSSSLYISDQSACLFSSSDKSLSSSCSERETSAGKSCEDCERDFNHSSSLFASSSDLFSDSSCFSPTQQTDEGVCKTLKYN